MLSYLNSRQDAGHVEDFGIQIRQVTHDKNKKRFNDANVIGESSYESSDETPNNSDYCTTNGYDGKGSKTSQNVSVLNVFCSHSNIGVKHVVQHLQDAL